jgi:hypothetical protein
MVATVSLDVIVVINLRFKVGNSLTHAEGFSIVLRLRSQILLERVRSWL